MLKLLGGIAVAALTTTIAVASDRSSENKPIKVFLLGGQSNMVGVARSAELPEGLREACPDVLIFGEGEWVPLKPGDKFGPEITFARAMSEAWPDERIGILKHARHGASMLDWDPDWTLERAKITELERFGPLYRQLMERVQQARETANIEVVGTLWMQGERDCAYEAVAREYFDNLNKLVERIRQDLDAPELPFVYGQVSQRNSRSVFRYVVRDAQARFEKAASFVTMVGTDDLPKPDNLHFDVVGTMELGRRYARAFLEVASRKPFKMDAPEKLTGK